MIRSAALLLAASLAVTGCIALPENADGVAREPAPRAGGMMTAEESRSEESGLCTGSVGLQNDRRFCASRTIVVTGTISGLPALDVSAQTFNGDLDITPSKEGAWGFTATLKARGATAADAIAALDRIEFRWAHESNGGHYLDIVAEKDEDTDELGASLAIQLPASIVLQVAAGTANGDASAAGIHTSALGVSTSNGDIVVDAKVAHVALTTANGDITAKLTPSADGRWTMATANGGISTTVPEQADIGYDIEGTTSNGEVEYKLRDGEKGACPGGSEYYTPPCTHRTFTSNRFSARDLQVRATLATSNGGITVEPK